MELPTKRMQTERKILGIPTLTFAIIVLLFIALAYYASGYASENGELTQQYGAAKRKVLSLSRMVEKFDKNLKICQSNLKNNEDSNRDLTLQLKKAVASKTKAESQKNQCDSQVSTFYQFYLNVKVKF